jgi:Rrf2 family protein
MRLTNTADYAIRCMIYIASLPPEHAVLRRDVATAQSIPSSFTAKILRDLARAGLLRSTRGPHGGFVIGRPANEISLLEVVEAIEGPLSLTQCVPDPEGCQHSYNCPANAVWASLQEQLAGLLRGVSLEDLVSAPRHGGRVRFDPTT